MVPSEDRGRVVSFLARLSVYRGASIETLLAVDDIVCNRSCELV